jgi:hypothetical protein
MSTVRLGIVGATLTLVAGACLPDYSFTSPDATADVRDPADAGGTDTAVRADGSADQSTLGDVGSRDRSIADDAPDDSPADVVSGDAEPTSVSLQDCILLLHMDEASWSSPGDVKDSSGQGNHGTAQGTASTTPDGKFGGAGSFDGQGYLIIPNAASLQPTNALTYTAWVYPTALPSANWPYPGVIAKRVSYTQSVAFTMFIWTQNALYADVPGRFNTEAGLTNDSWYHLAVVYDGNAGRVKLYINGRPDPPFAAEPTLDPNDADLTIAYLPQGPGGLDPNGFFVGKIDEVAIWTRVLTDNEIWLLYNATGPL